MQRITTPLGEVAVSVSGNGPAIVMWPSLLMDHTLWAAQVEHFAGRFTTERSSTDSPSSAHTCSATRGAR